MRCFQYAALALTVATSASADVTDLLEAAPTGALYSLPPTSYLAAKYQFPELAAAILKVETHAVAAWYTDRDNQYASAAYQLLQNCKNTAVRLNLVVYGLPNKDCASGSSPATSESPVVKTGADYEAFLADFTQVLGNRKIAYVLEPGAVGLLAVQAAEGANSCAQQAGYLENLRTAVKLLSANPKADIYVDVGHWVLASDDTTARVVEIITKLAESGRVKGIALNTSNYRPTAELAELCAKFQAAMGSKEYNCIVDTSRNYVAASAVTALSTTTSEWCNLRSAGIGQPPTSTTGFSNLDFFLWIKPPGESDGKCDDGTHTQDSLQGPEAGAFFEQGFAALWNQGYFVDQLSLAKVSDTQTPSPASNTRASVAKACATPEWGACGNSSGAQCCPSDFYCQPWNSGYYQCMGVPTQCPQQLTDVDLVGAELLVVTGISPADCCSKCAETSGCKGYTFVSEGGQSCSLKSQASGQQRVVGPVSGILN